MKRFPVYYEVNYYDSEMQRRQDSGFVIANSYADAVAEIEEIYASDLIDFNILAMLEENSLCFLPVEAGRAIKKIIEENFPY